ncbi:LacI family transcriptional regulator [Kocuria rosea subsp. polaris]|uniref:LacI family transcriptional regulator n=1 Tax=Kocuria rosea subsp. polaris TaxID=136273 RepID=A0A0W8I6H8_KOCRO|nr:LacI family DNA-binding transcriptional regulator [Kocuria polaris]KUG53864.1 LacI family transcriptional regulator [Kocuria polaris]
MARKSVGIRDVARAAGVSVTTVSHVLNDTPHTRVSEETKKKVRDAAAALGYGPNRMAQGLRTQRSAMLGLLSEDIATTPHAGMIIKGAEETARKHDYTLVIINTDKDADPASKHRDVDALLERQVDGILYATMYHRAVSLPPRLFEIPAVLIDATDRTGLVPCTVPDERGGARTAVMALLEAGHRRIGFVNNTDDVPATHGRLEGYRDALKAAGIDFDPGLVAARESEAAGGYEAALEQLDRPDRPTALFCYNDRMAMGAYRAAAQLGLAIPQDLSVIGFDNQELIATGLHPGLTTMALPHYDMGAWAVETLIRLIDGHAEEKLLADRPTLLPCPLVRRDSIAPPRDTTRKPAPDPHPPTD